jgi:DNA-binding NtrC family response regulator
MTRACILVAEDDPAMGKVLVALLQQVGHEVVLVRDGVLALTAIRERDVDVLLTDLRMPGIDGMELLRRVRAERADLPVVMLTAHGTVPLAVEAMKVGASDFLLKPFDRAAVLYAIDKALAASAWAEDRPPRVESPSNVIIGEAPALIELRRQLSRVATTDATVLVTGETGTGKELVARAVHAESVRASGPFVAVNCAALPEALLEAEVFGYRKGAFTGAATTKPGRVEIAASGTLFLDEIGDMPPAIQPKILRLLQELEYTPLGDTRARRADVRFVAATHRDLAADVAAGRFREDLYYRLNVFPLRVPPLRERPMDIPVLARRFCDTFARMNRRPELHLTDAALSRLSRYPWPGNVRELQSFVERLVILSEGPTIDETDVGRELERTSTLARAPDPASDSVHESRFAAERAALVAALARSPTNRSQAARILGVSRRTLYNMLTRHGL